MLFTLRPRPAAPAGQQNPDRDPDRPQRQRQHDHSDRLQAEHFERPGVHSTTIVRVAGFHTGPPASRTPPWPSPWRFLASGEGACSSVVLGVPPASGVGPGGRPRSGAPGQTRCAGAGPAFLAPPASGYPPKKPGPRPRGAGRVPFGCPDARRRRNAMSKPNDQLPPHDDAAVKRH